MNFKCPARAFAATILLTGSVATPASLSAQTPLAASVDATEFLSFVNEESIIPALSAVTASHIVGHRPDGATMFVAVAGNGLRFEVSLRACLAEEQSDAAAPPRHCRGILMLSSWDSAPASEAQGLGETVASFLIENPAVNAGMNRERAPYIARYVIADHGTAQGNLVAEFANFINSATAFQNAISQFYRD